MKNLTKLCILILILIQTAAYMGVSYANSLQTEAQPSVSPVVQENMELKSRIEILENQVSYLESRVSNTENNYNNFQSGASVGAESFLFGAFCALWAQNTKRNTFGWFIIGAIGTVFAVLAVLWNNHYGIANDSNKSD